MVEPQDRARLEELAGRFRRFGVETAPRAPLYARLSSSIADDADLIALLAEAPEEQQLPVLLFAAVHDLLLRGSGPELAVHYPNLNESAVTEQAGLGGPDPFPAFRSVALANADELRRLVTTRVTQTNEVGRCALFVMALQHLADDPPGPLSLIDVGTSAGLTLLLDRFRYRYEPGGSVGGDSSVEIVCGTRGPVPAGLRMPEFGARIGVDAAPIDVLDDAAVRWLEACVWPDQRDRFLRLQAAIALGRADPPDVRRGDAVDSLPALVEEVGSQGHPVVLNSWVLCYLTEGRRRRYVEVLDEIGAERDLSWVVAESPYQTPGLPIPTTEPPEDRTVLSVVRWRHGRRTVRRVGTAHPHGFWLHLEPEVDVTRPSGGAAPDRG